MWLERQPWGMFMILVALLKLHWYIRYTPLMLYNVFSFHLVHFHPFTLRTLSKMVVHTLEETITTEML